MTLWDLYCQTLAISKITYTYANGTVVVLPELLKPFILGQAILESGRGTTPLAKYAWNFHALKWRSDIKVNFNIGKYSYNAGDGLFDYCMFFSILNEIFGYWAFVHRSPYYDGIDNHLASGKDYLDFIGPHYCPPGYKLPWIISHGWKNYTNYINDYLVPEATTELKKYTGNPPPPPPPVPTSYKVTNGVLTGEQTKYHQVSNYDHFNRPKTDGLVIHGTGCFGGKGANGDYPGILDGWSTPGGVSAHILIMRDGTIWQAVNLVNQAWHCYAHNNHTIGIELENFGPTYLWQEVSGYFYRFKGKPWEQKIAKSEMVLISGMYYQNYTDTQINRLNQIIPAIKVAYPTIQFIKPHSEMSFNATWDTGPTLPKSVVPGMS